MSITPRIIKKGERRVVTNMINKMAINKKGIILNTSPNTKTLKGMLLPNGIIANEKPSPNKELLLTTFHKTFILHRKYKVVADERHVPLGFRKHGFTLRNHM